MSEIACLRQLDGFRFLLVPKTMHHRNFRV